MGASVNEEERRIMADRLIAMQHTLRTVFEACDAQATMCRDAGTTRLAFAVHMVRESLIGYSKELNTFVLRVMGGESLADEDDEFPLDL